MNNDQKLIKRGKLMKLLRTVDAAKKDIKILQSFVDLVESYEPTTLEQHIKNTPSLEVSTKL